MYFFSTASFLKKMLFYAFHYVNNFEFHLWMYLLYIYKMCRFCFYYVKENQTKLFFQLSFGGK